MKRFATKLAAARIATMLTAAVIAEIRAHHRAGQVVRDILAIEEHGTHVVMELAHELRCKPARVRRLAQFAATFTSEELMVMEDRRMPDGRPLALSHLLALLPIANRWERANIARAAADQGLSVAALKTLVGALGESRKRRGVIA